MGVKEERQTQLLRGVLDLCALAVMAEEPVYGYELTKRLHSRGLSTVGEGSVYPLLGRLERPEQRIAAFVHAGVRYSTDEPATTVAFQREVVRLTDEPGMETARALRDAYRDLVEITASLSWYKYFNSVI